MDSRPLLEPTLPLFPISLWPILTSHHPPLPHWKLPFLQVTVWFSPHGLSLFCYCPTSPLPGPELCPFPQPHPVPAATYLRHSLDTFSGTLTCSLLHARVSRHFELYPELTAFAPKLSSLCSSFRRRKGAPVTLIKNPPGVPSWCIPSGQLL